MVDTSPEIDAFVARLAPLDRAANIAWWEASTKVSEEHEARRVATDLALRDVLGDPELFAALDPRGTAPRSIELLRDRMQPHQVAAATRTAIVELEAEIDATFNAFRPKLDGVPVNDNAIAEVLRQETDAGRRRRAWLASKEIGPAVADQVRELAHLRNASARELGSRDYFDLTLATQELDESQLFSTLEAVDQATAAPFRAWKKTDDAARAQRFGCATAQLRPWHYDDAFFQAAPRADDLDLEPWFADADLVALTQRTYAGIGLDIEPIVVRSDLLPRDAKSQHAFCIDIDRGGDVRVLCNNVAGAYWADTMLHEFGHAVYDTYVDPDLPWLQRSMHPLTTEGIAMMFGRLTLDPEWLVEVAGIERHGVDAARSALADRRRVALLVFARWVLVMTHFEHGFYADPDANHNDRWWDLVERFQLIIRPDGRDAPDWASKIHVALAPVYYQNYLLGELVASQLQATLHARFGGIVGRPAVGEFLREEVFGPGWSVRWDELIARATGAPLGVEAFAAELAELSQHAVD